MGPQIIDVVPTKNSLPNTGFGLVIGRATNFQRGLQIQPAIVTFPTCKPKVIVQATLGAAIVDNDRPLAQLLCWEKIRDQRAKQGSNFAALSLSLENRPLWPLVIQGKTIQGLLDTGADVSIIAADDWPPSWPTQESENTLVGLGTTHAPPRSASILTWTDNEGHSGQFQPYICKLPVTLWGRDVLQELRLTLTNEKGKQQGSQAVWNIMTRMGYKGGGLGAREQGITTPISPKGEKDRHGLGFQEGPPHRSQSL